MHLLKTGCQQMAGKEDKNEQSKHKEFMFLALQNPQLFPVKIRKDIDFGRIN